MEKRSYWDRVQKQRISRRRLIGGTAALGVGAAGLYLVGCGDGGGPEGETTPQPTVGREPVGTRGGIFRAFTFDALLLDTYDPHQTQFGPTYNMHSAVFSQILHYEDEVQQIMSPDLADGMPEQASETEYVIKLRPNVTFHDTPRIRSDFPDVAGRQLTAEDVKFSIERQTNEQSPRKDLYYRKGQWQTIERIEVMNDLELKITTKKPIAPFLHFLADRNAYIVSQLLVDDKDEMNDTRRMVGTGPFILDAFEQGQFVKVRRNPNWFAKDDNPGGIGTGRPFLDGYDSLWTPMADATQEVALKQKEVDATGFEDDNNTKRIEEEGIGVRLKELGIGGRIGIRLLVDRPPFNDPRIRRAIHLALDRSILGQQMFPAAPGRVGALPSGPVGWPIVRWALPREELDTLPGYRFATAAERDEDIAEAKALWEAAQGPSSFAGALGANIPLYIPQKGTPELVRELQNVLNFDISSIETVQYIDLAKCLLLNQQDAPEGTCAFAFGFDNGWIDLDDWVYPYFVTNGPKNSFRLSDSTLDDMLEAQREAFDFEERQQIGYDIQRYLLQEGNDGLGVLADIPLVNGITRSLTWSYVKNDFNPRTWFGHNYLFANVWLDQNDPNYRGRPA